MRFFVVRLSQPLDSPSHTLTPSLSFVHARQRGPQPKPGRTARRLQRQQAHAQAALGGGATHDEGQINQVPVGGGVQEAGGRVKPGQAVAGAGHNLEELGQGVDEIKHLGHQEDEQRLREVAQDAGDGEGGAGKVGVGVSDELGMVGGWWVCE